jgi:hypothetical protein
MDNSADPKPSRRWARFGLRGFFVFVTLAALCAAWIGMHVNRVHRSNHAIAQLQVPQDGRTVTIRYASPFAHAETLWGEEPGFPQQFTPKGPGLLTRLLGVDIFQSPVSLTFAAPGNSFSWDRDTSGRLVFIREYKSGLTDADMKWVGALSNLQFLSLEPCGITDEGIKHLEDLPHLESLRLTHTAITDDGLVVLLKLPQLKNLDLRSTDVSDAAIGVLSQCHRLQTLDLQMTNVTPEGVATLRERLPNCQIEQ